MIWLVLILLLSGCTEPASSLAQPLNDGRTEWTKEGKAKIRAEHEAIAKKHDAESDTWHTTGHWPKISKWIVVIGTTPGINNMVHGGWWPYLVAKPFETKQAALIYMNRWCDPRGCVLIYGVEQ